MATTKPSNAVFGRRDLLYLSTHLHPNLLWSHSPFLGVIIMVIDLLVLRDTRFTTGPSGASVLIKTVNIPDTTEQPIQHRCIVLTASMLQLQEKDRNATALPRPFKILHDMQKFLLPVLLPYAGIRSHLRVTNQKSRLGDVLQPSTPQAR